MNTKELKYYIDRKNAGQATIVLDGNNLVVLDKRYDEVTGVEKEPEKIIVYAKEIRERKKFLKKVINDAQAELDNLNLLLIEK